ncbi:MAG TPA: trypsin-like peptidase domain-containing protein [Nitrososphaeraceae archaeon]
METTKLSATLAILFVVITSVLIPLHQRVMAQLTSSTLPAYQPDTIFNMVDNSVVQITTRNPNLQTQNATELGSGFIYDKQGHIITNNHVVDGAKLVDVTFVDGSRYVATTIGRDAYSDIAVLQIVGNLTHSPKPLIIANSSKLKIGEPVFAIGHPFGIENTMTAGIIGQTRYLLSIPQLGVFTPDVIQTDAAINPGNSGGPLVNTKGEVIGLIIGRIISIGAPGPYPGLTVAASSNTITRIVSPLIRTGTYTHPYLGLAGITLTSNLAESIEGLARNFKGILISSIVKDGPADTAGIQGSTVDKYAKTHWGDIITAVDGHHLVRIEDLISYIEEHRSVGNQLTLTVYREGQMFNLNTTLSARPLQNVQKYSSPPL